MNENNIVSINSKTKLRREKMEIKEKTLMDLIRADKHLYSPYVENENENEKEIRIKDMFDEEMTVSEFKKTMLIKNDDLPLREVLSDYPDFDDNILR